VPREQPREIRYAPQPQPEIRYVEVPAQPVHHQTVIEHPKPEEARHAPKHEKVGKYVQVPQELYEKLLSQ